MAEFLTIELLTFNCRQMRYCTRHIYAGMAELADALDLGSSGETVQVQVLLPVLFTRVSEVFITSEILIFFIIFPIRKDTTMQAYKDLVKALPGLKEDMPRAFYMLAELF